MSANSASAVALVSTSRSVLFLGSLIAARNLPPDRIAVSSKWPNFLEHPRVPVAEMRQYAACAVESRLSEGRKRAIDGAARELGLSPRRVIGLLRGEVRRIWADELLDARAWYRKHVERQARLLEQQAAVHRALLDDWNAE